MGKVIILAAAVCLIGQAAFAHAFLDRASPAVGSEVSKAPSAVILTYTEPVEPAFSTIHVTGANGERVDEGKPAVQNNGRVMSIRLKALFSGVYAVDWHVTSVDTHKSDGHFTFTVRP
jgi:methionine-rich copper-binding protein CopC